MGRKRESRRREAQRWEGGREREREKDNMLTSFLIMPAPSISPAIILFGMPMCLSSLRQYRTAAAYAATQKRQKKKGKMS